MKKLLLAVIVLASLLTTNLSASQVPTNKQDMLRTGEPAAESEQINLEESTGGDQHVIVVIFTTAIIITIVGLASIFITRFALSLRGKEEDIYISKDDKEPQSQKDSQ